MLSGAGIDCVIERVIFDSIEPNNPLPVIRAEEGDCACREIV